MSILLIYPILYNAIWPVRKKFEPLFSVPCGLQPALSSGDIGIRVAGTLRARSEGAERHDRGNGDLAGSRPPVRLGIPCHHPATDRQPDEGVYFFFVGYP